MTDHALEVVAKLAGIAVGLATLGTLSWKGLRAMIRTIRRLGRVADEVLGDGDTKPGWGKRLAGIEALGKTNASRLTSIESRLSGVEAEVRPNGGASMRDQITRIEEATGATRDETT